MAGGSESLNSLSMNLKDIKGIIDLMKKNAVSEFEMEEGDFKIKLKRAPSKRHKGEVGVAQEGLAIVTAPVAAPAVPAPATVQATPVPAPEPVDEGLEVKSPMIGTLYRRPSPDSDPFVEVGTAVEPDTVVCIIEAMKVMNEIKAEVKGVIAEELVEDGKPVEYGQALFRIEPN